MEAARSRSRSPRGAAAPAGPSETLKNLNSLILGLERRKDRRERCETMLTKEVPWLKTEFFPATDGRADKIPETEVSNTWNTMNNSNYGEYEDVKDADGNVLHTAEQFADPGVDYGFSPGERGCAHSHYRMWERVVAENKAMLILEDDVQLVFERADGEMTSGKSFTERFEVGMKEAEKEKAEVLYLGWSGFRGGNYKFHETTDEPLNPFIRRVEYVWTTVAYVLWPEGARKLLAASKPMNQPVDNFMAWEAREHRLNSWVLLDTTDDDDAWSGGIVGQVDFNGDSDIQKSDGGDQGHDPTEFLASKSGA